MTQTLGHLLRIIYYGAIISVETVLPNWLFLAAVTAVLGTRIGTWLLSRWDDAGFQHISGLIILCTGSAYPGQLPVTPATTGLSV